jgi:hypothetical protein
MVQSTSPGLPKNVTTQEVDDAPWVIEKREDFEMKGIVIVVAGIRLTEID